MNSFFGGGERGIPHIRLVAAAPLMDAGEAPFINKASRMKEATKTSFAVRDLLSFADHPQGRQLYKSLLPVTVQRLANAARMLGDTRQDKQLRDIVAQPLREVFDPTSEIKWYDRAALAQRVALLNPAVMRGYEQYDREQEHSQQRETNRRSRDFIGDFLDTAVDVPILQGRLQDVYNGHMLSSGLPLDVWIYETVRALQTFPIEDLHKIADHPVGGKLLVLYKQFDELLRVRNVQTV